MISSTSNDRIRRILQLQKKAKVRRKEGVFVAEGLRMVAETPDSLLEEVYVSERFLAEHGSDETYGKLQSRMPIEVSDAVMTHMSDTVTPQGILALVRKPSYRWPDLLDADRTQLLILDHVQDPGNLGTMFRTAEGAGVTGIIMSEDTVDLFSPKVIRSTMGSLYRVPWLVAEDLVSCLRRLKEEGVCLYAAHLRADCDYDRANYRGACGFLIGNEGKGLGEASAALADVRIRIPMGGQLESLNAAMAAGILMYEAARQRREGRK